MSLIIKAAELGLCCMHIHNGACLMRCAWVHGRCMGVLTLCCLIPTECRPFCFPRGTHGWPLNSQQLASAGCAGAANSSPAFSVPTSTLLCVLAVTGPHATMEIAFLAIYKEI